MTSRTVNGLVSLAAMTVFALTWAPAGAVAQSNGIRDPPRPASTAPGPLYHDFRGVRLGMTAEEVRARLGKPKDKGEDRDYLEFSDQQGARVY